MYNVLLFDDRPQIRISFMERCEEYNINIIPCRDIYEADEEWAEKKDDIHAIVLDIMMSPKGLKESLRDKTKGGLLTGWFWLWKQINPQNLPRHPAQDKCLIIYSAYEQDYKQYIQQADDDEKKFSIDHTKFIDKNDVDADKVLEYLKNNITIEKN